MSLQFLGETGVYLPQKDAIRITALTVGAHIGCLATRSALSAIGCTREDTPRALIDRFEQNRLGRRPALIVWNGVPQTAHVPVTAGRSAASFAANCRATSIRSPSANNTSRPAAVSIGLARLETA